MNRTLISNPPDDDYGDHRIIGWFDRDAADAYEENTRWDGHNMISCATNRQWAHETLYRTAGKKWVLYRTSAWQGARDSYHLVSNEDAASWLLTNGHEPPTPETRDLIAALEVK